jgi:hypothetical protein
MLRSQVWPIFGEKIGAFLKNRSYDPEFAKTCGIYNKKMPFLPII